MSLTASYAISAVFNGKDKNLSPVISKIEKKYGSLAGTAARSVTKMNGAINKAAKIGAVAAGAIVVGLSRATMAYATAGDEAAKTSRRIGMSAEAFQELQFAADRSGISGQEMSKSFQKLNKNVGDLRAGTGMLTTLLNKSNPALSEQLKNAKDNEEAFNLITGAIGDLKNPMDKASLAQAAFGRSGMKMLNMMEGGTKGLSDLREEARKYGGIISNEAAADSEKFVDSLTNMKAAFTGLKNKALLPLMRTFGPYIQMLSDYIAKNKEVIGQNIEKVFKSIAEAVKSIDMKEVEKSFMGFIETLKMVNKFVQFIGGWGTMAAIILTLAGTVKVLNAVMTVSNIVMNANPVSLLIIGIAGLIAITIIASKRYEEFGAALMFVMSIFNPALGAIFIAVALFNELRVNWESLSDSFKQGGFINGMKTLGAVILQFVLRPLMQVIEFLEKIPLIKKLGLSGKIGGLMDENQAFIDRDNQTMETDRRAAEIQNRYALAPNGQKAESEQTRAVMGAGTITVRAEEGTAANIDSGNMDQTGWDMTSLGKDGI